MYTARPNNWYSSIYRQWASDYVYQLMYAFYIFYEDVGDSERQESASG